MERQAQNKHLGQVAKHKQETSEDRKPCFITTCERGNDHDDLCAEIVRHSQHKKRKHDMNNDSQASAKAERRGVQHQTENLESSKNLVSMSIKQKSS